MEVNSVRAAMILNWPPQAGQTVGQHAVVADREHRDVRLTVE